jgi:hypothetical protein
MSFGEQWYFHQPAVYITQLKCQSPPAIVAFPQCNGEIICGYGENYASFGTILQNLLHFLAKSFRSFFAISLCTKVCSVITEITVTKTRE